MTTREELEARLEPYWAERPVWKGLDIYDGWIDLADALVTDLLLLDGPFPEIQQIKTKYGGLRFYVGRATADQNHVIRVYEEASTSTCEICAGAGTGVTIGYWYWTLCDSCRVQKESERRSRRIEAGWEDDGGQ